MPAAACPMWVWRDVVSSEIRTKNFGRIAAQTARQVIIQGIREAERSKVYDAFTEKTSELMSGVVSRIDDRSGALYVKLMANGETTEAMLSAGEQVKGETSTIEGRPDQGLSGRGAPHRRGALRW